MADTTPVTTQRGFLSQPCRYKDKVRADLSGRTYSTDDHSIIKHGHDIFYKFFLIILCLRKHFFRNELWNKAHFGKRNLLENHLIFFGGGGGHLKCFLRCETMFMDWLFGFISLTREFYLLQKKKKKKIVWNRTQWRQIF